MKQLFLDIKIGKLVLVNTPKPLIKDNHVIVETKYSALSLGTESMLVSFGQKNILEKIKARPDDFKILLSKMKNDGIINTIESAFNRLSEPIPVGYSGVGKVISVGDKVDNIEIGDNVAMMGTAYHSEINLVNNKYLVKVEDDDKKIKSAAFAALGAISINGIRQSNILGGDRVAIVGFGLIGRITSKILKAYGCSVTAFDVFNLNQEVDYLDDFININNDDSLGELENFESSPVFDSVIICAATNDKSPFELATKIVKRRGIVCLVGVAKIEIDRDIFYDKEIIFKIARSYGAGRYDNDYEKSSRDYPGYLVKYTAGRNLNEFIRLINSNQVNLEDLVEDIVDLNSIPERFDQIISNKMHGVLIEYSKPDYPIDTIKKADFKIDNKNRINIGLIGTGNFSKNTLLPFMEKTNRFNFYGLASTGGVSIAQAGYNFDFKIKTNDYKKLLSNPDIDLIIIATQHNSHADLIIEALEQGKHVYCEKPIAISLDQLERVKKAYYSSKKSLMIGFNRRYSPIVNQIKRRLEKASPKKIYNYYINSKKSTSKQWIDDLTISGGRHIGEAIHFIDLIKYIDNSSIQDLKLTNLDKTNFIYTLRLSSGSIGNVIYSTIGSNAFPKEEITINYDGITERIINFTRTIKYTNFKRFDIRLRQQKGFKEEFNYFYNVIKNESVYDIHDVFTTHELILKSLKVKGD